MSAEGSGVRLTPSVYCRCPDNCLHTSDCAVHNEPAEEAGNCTCMTPAQKRALPDAHYSDGRRYSHISKAWIFAEDWNDREEVARLNAALAALTKRVYALGAERDAAKRELFVVAEALWQNVNREDMKHWAQNIRVSVLGPDAVKITDTERDALAARVAQLESALNNLLVMLPSSDQFIEDHKARIPQSFCYVRWLDIIEARAALRPATRGTEEDSDVHRGAK